jgi:hypothetical protein
MKLHLAPDRKPFGDDLDILGLEPLASAWRRFRSPAANQRLSVSELAAPRKRFVDRHVPRLAILDEEDGVGDPVEELDSRKRPSKDGGERRSRITLVGGARRIVLVFNP